MKTWVLRIRAVDKEIFDALVDGRKSIETRAITPRNLRIVAGDQLLFMCGLARLRMSVARVRRFRSVAALARACGARNIHPHARTAADLRKMYARFDGYLAAIRTRGILALTLE